MIPDRLDRRLAIPKGTMVRVRTTNGGEAICRLAAVYRPTYSITLDDKGYIFSIYAGRIASVAIAE